MRLILIICLLFLLTWISLQLHSQLLRANRSLQTIELHLRIPEPDLPQP